MYNGLYKTYQLFPLPALISCRYCSFGCIPSQSSFTSLQLIPKYPIFLQTIPFMLIFRPRIFLSNFLFKSCYNICSTLFTKVSIRSITLKYLIHTSFTKDSCYSWWPLSSNIWAILWWLTHRKKHKFVNINVQPNIASSTSKHMRKLNSRSKFPR